jgi:hypothetical protein
MEKFVESLSIEEYKYKEYKKRVMMQLMTLTLGAYNAGNCEI